MGLWALAPVPFCRWGPYWLGSAGPAYPRPVRMAVLARPLWPVHVHTDHRPGNTHWPVRDRVRPFGRHAADAMRWSGGCGGCWSPPRHRPGWCHLRKWSSAGTLRKLNVPKGCIARARHGPTGLPSEPSFPEDVARQAASFAFERVETKELAADHAVAGGAKCGRWSESAWREYVCRHTESKNLRVGGLVV